MTKYTIKSSIGENTLLKDIVRECFNRHRIGSCGSIEAAKENIERLEKKLLDLKAGEVERHYNDYIRECAYFGFSSSKALILKKHEELLLEAVKWTPQSSGALMLKGAIIAIITESRDKVRANNIGFVEPLEEWLSGEILYTETGIQGSRGMLARLELALADELEALKDIDKL